MALLLANNGIYFGKDGLGAPQLKRYLARVQSGVVPSTWWTHEDAGHNDESRKESKVLFELEDPFSTPKPERLVQRILNIASNPNDLILDSFLGSGTTAAVAHKMGRRWIGIEMGDHAATHCLPRLQKVIEGEQGGISKAVNWQGGGGFRFMRLGEPVFDAQGRIHSAVRFATLAAFVWQQETGTSFNPAQATPGTPFIGIHYIYNSYLSNEYADYRPISLVNTPADTLTHATQGAAHSAVTPSAEVDLFSQPAVVALADTAAASTPPHIPLPSTQPTAYYLLYNGILGDKRPTSGNVLTREVLAAILALHASYARKDAQLVVYGDSVRVGPARLASAGVVFKQIPYDIRAR